MTGAFSVKARASSSTAKAIHALLAWSVRMVDMVSMVFQPIERMTNFPLGLNTMQTVLTMQIYRVAPLSPDELRKVHEIKRTFSAMITS